jgi:diguanylate cyclase (GGDEF)-like protein/PAS domain S-box-containing protein
MPNANGVNKRRFVGLQWKGFLLLSLLLLCLSAAFYALNYQALMAQFRTQRQTEALSLRHHISGLFTGASDRLIRLGGALAAMSDVGEALRTRDPDKISAAVVDYASFRYELDLGWIELYSTDLKRVGRWAQSDAEGLPEDYVQHALEKTREEEAPLTLLYCQPLCLLYAFAPLLSGGENVGAVALGQSIADFIIDFRLITGADIAVLVPNATHESSELAQWRMRVPALTNASRFTALLQHLSQIYASPREINPVQLIKWNKAYYEINYIPLNEIIPGQAGFIILSSDVSKSVQGIQDAQRQTILATLAGLVVAELLLLYLIRRSLRRLERFVGILPLLAKGAYDRARAHFSNERYSPQFPDEIDYLYDSAIILSYQLEQNSHDLDSRNRELAKERDFIQGLLASAQVLIITQTRKGIIRAANDFAAQLTGYAPYQLKGLKFVDLLADANAKQGVLEKLEALCSNGQRRMEQELEVLGGDGKVHKVVWVHTPLHATYTNGTAVLSVGLDVTERARAESRMRWLANHDALTSLVNRNRFIEELSRAFDEATRTGVTAALLILDLDYFKEINDSSGHAAGDALLRRFADELLSRARKSDIVARLGGDEFAVLMPQTNSHGAETFAKQLNERLLNTPFVFGDKHYKVGASIGIALLPKHGANVQDLMANADLAMYEAKHAGRSCARVFTQAQKPKPMLTAPISWKEILTQAIAEEQLFFHFQPVVQMKTGQVAYSEALLRLKMADGRIALPGEFLPAMERAGLNYEMDCYVVRTVLKILSRQPDKRISINFSTAALSNSGWISMLIEAIQSHQLAADSLIFEITETAVIADMAKARHIIAEITELGFHFTVDNFGVGFNSLYYLKHLPAEYVKIDRSLIKNMVTNKGDCDFVQAIIAMIHAYGKQAVAPGVESAATYKLLKDLSIDLIQGFYLSYPDEEIDFD